MGECPQCHGWCGDYDLCYECAEEFRAHQRQAVRVPYKQVTAETQKALRVVFDDADPFSIDAKWVPKSLVEDRDEETKEMWLPRWFCDREDIETLEA